MTAIAGLLKRHRNIVALVVATTLVTLAVRLPAIAWPVFNWDESTFLAVGKRLPQLPYTSTLENKPPLAFLPYSLPSLFGTEDLRFARLLAALVVAATGTLVGLATSQRLTVRLPTAVFTVIMISAVPGGDAWMTEINVVLLGAVAAYLVTRLHRDQRTSLYGFGIIVGALPLFRTNWALVAAMFGVMGIVISLRRKGLLRFALGVCSPWVLVIAVYALSGHWKSLVLGAVLIPASINAGSHGDLSLPEGMARMALISAGTMLLSLLLRLGTTRSKAPDLVAMAGLLLLVLPAFPEYADYDHHTLQIVPFLAFGVGRLMDVVASRSAASAPPWRFAILAGSIALAVAIGGISISANWRTSFISARTNTGISQAQEKHAAESQLSTFLRNLPLKYRTTLALQDHFVFWNANLDPVLPEAVHPSMLTNPQVLQVLYGKKIGDTGIIQKALARSPEIVLRVPGPITPEADSELRAALHRRYDLIAEIDNVEVWKLSP